MIRDTSKNSRLIERQNALEECAVLFARQLTNLNPAFFDEQFEGFRNTFVEHLPNFFNLVERLS